MRCYTPSDRKSWMSILLALGHYSLEIVVQSVSLTTDDFDKTLLTTKTSSSVHTCTLC